MNPFLLLRQKSPLFGSVLVLVVVVILPSLLKDLRFKETENKYGILIYQKKKAKRKIDKGEKDTAFLITLIISVVHFLFILAQIIQTVMLKFSMKCLHWGLSMTITITIFLSFLFQKRCRQSSINAILNIPPLFFF